MSPWMNYLISALVAGIISAGGVMLASISENGGEISYTALIVGGITFLVSAAKDVQSRMQPPPPPLPTVR